MLHRSQRFRHGDHCTGPRTTRAGHGGRGFDWGALSPRLLFGRQQESARCCRVLPAGIRYRHRLPRCQQAVEADDQGRSEVTSGAPYSRLTPEAPIADIESVNVDAPRGASLSAIQKPIRDKLDAVSRAMAAIVASDLPLVGEVSAHLLAMRGKLFRPTLLLLSSEVDEQADALGFSEDEYYALIKSKTASLMRAACELGAISGARRHRVQLGDFGENLGMAFQITDDLLDYREEKETTGKPSGLDLREHKVTLPLIHALRRMSPAARKEVEGLFARDGASDDEIASVVAIVGDNGRFRLSASHR